MRVGDRAPFVSVIVPTYRRPEYLRACLEDLALQDVDEPYEVVVVRRLDDSATLDVARIAASRHERFRVRTVVVPAPGFVRALRAGVASAKGSLLAFCDDDARYPSDWLRRLTRLLRDPSVGGAGGPIVGDEEGADRLPPSLVSPGRVARVGWFGRTEYNAHRSAAFDAPCEVDFLPGANMAFRREALREDDFDPVLDAPGCSPGNELALCGSVRARDFRLLFEPAAPVRHLSAPWVEGVRAPTATRTEVYSRNLVYVMLRMLPRRRRIAFLLYFVVIGQWESPGLLVWLVGRVTGRVPHRRWLAVAMRGKRAGWRLARSHA